MHIFILNVFYSSYLFWIIVSGVFILSCLYYSKVVDVKYFKLMQRQNNVRKADIVFGFNDGDVLFGTVFAMYVGIVNFYFLFLFTLVFMVVFGVCVYFKNFCCKLGTTLVP